jgi:hypothetical protein
MPRKALLWSILALGACTASSSTQTPRQSARQCFWPSEVSGFSDAGPSRALVRVGSREVWELTVSSGCPDVNWALRIGIRARAGERICPGRPAELLIPEASGSGFRRCPVRDVRKLTAEEAAAARGEASSL